MTSNTETRLRNTTPEFFKLGSLQPWGSAKACQVACKMLMKARAFCMLNVRLTVHYDMNYLPDTNLMHKISLFIKYYIPLHVSSNNMLILRRSNCIYSIWYHHVHLQRVTIPNAVYI
jgi:hypothetical protein